MEGNQSPSPADVASANSLKDQGNAAFTAKRFAEAVALFTGAIALDGTNHIFFSNRSGAHLSMGNADAAVADAKRCIAINPKWRCVGAAAKPMHASKCLCTLLNRYFSTRHANTTPAARASPASAQR